MPVGFRSQYLRRAMRKTLQLLQRKQSKRPLAMALMLSLSIQLVECRITNH
nr:hypothetical protein Iba_chr03bCG5830 [Ipomoea batatas]GME00836.1 hypothetical protein Iba_scaffold473827CG0010 [Ipomoea batatas]